MSNLVGNPEDRFSHNEAHLVILMRFLQALLAQSASRKAVKKKKKKAGKAVAEQAGEVDMEEAES